MGNLLVRRRRRGQLGKRARSEDDDEDAADEAHSIHEQAAVQNEADVTALLRARVGPDAGPLCRCVVQGDAVEQRYGGHYHLYASTSPDDGHGVALVWSLRRAHLSLLALLTFCRVANSCHKRAVLLDEEDSTLLLLRYTTEL